MFARNTHFQLKSLNLAAEFASRFENEMLPLLRQQKGFKGEITLSNPGSLEQIAISLWDSKHHADVYDANIYPKVLQILTKLIDGTPKIRTFDAVTLNVDPSVVAVKAKT